MAYAEELEKSVFGILDELFWQRFTEAGLDSSNLEGYEITVSGNVIDGYRITFKSITNK